MMKRFLFAGVENVLFENAVPQSLHSMIHRLAS